ncbi:MAG: hypothetical protein CSA84_03735 [Actinomycetales bacterium]|nr:MAG: hypothetical protein CSA84_03735 [Actinomycetales bacterium]
MSTSPSDPNQPSDAPTPPPGQPGASVPPPPPPGYGQSGIPPQGQPAPGQQPLQPGEERTYAMLGHIGGILLGFLAPLIVMLVWGPRNSFVKDQSTEALNFQITIAIAWLTSILLSFIAIGFFLMPIVVIISIVFGIMGGVEANKGQAYRYPLALRLIK